jgi:hypothetical protein
MISSFGGGRGVRRGGCFGSVYGGFDTREVGDDALLSP